MQLRFGKRAVVGIVLCLIVVAALVAAALWQWGGGQRLVPKPRNAPDALVAAGLERLPARPDDVASQRLEPLAADAARKRNAGIPFAELRPQAARPFRFAGSALDRARALDCLALTAMAEAGGGDADQRAVIQVVLNRVRHPAFPKTICGVVFQGAERVTGCQFTYTCDGSLARRYSDAAWAAARRRAAQALDGRVFVPVGTATHYHTDWVHPVWSGELDKIARVDTHLFFRWPGYWGSRDAARLAYGGGEPGVSHIAWLASHAAAAKAEAPAAAAAPSEAALAAVPQAGPKAGDRVGIGRIVARHPERAAYLLHLTQRPDGPAALATGRRLCGGNGYCQVLAWSDRAAVPSGFPVTPPARAGLSFSYVLDATNAEYVFYDCTLFPDTPRERCLPPPSPR